MSADPKTLPLGTLIEMAVNRSVAAPYVRELRSRLEENPDLVSKMDALENNTRTWDDDPPRPEVKVAADAREILRSNWDFSGLKQPPDQVHQFVTDLARSNATESMLSPGQFNYWRAVMGKYRVSMGLRRGAA